MWVGGHESVQGHGYPLVETVEHVVNSSSLEAGQDIGASLDVNRENVLLVTLFNDEDLIRLLVGHVNELIRVGRMERKLR